MSEFDWEDFEQDFWKNAGQRKTWDQIIPGELRNTVPVTLTREVIRRFAEGIGDPNPLYIDEAYAKTTPFGGIIAPPSIHIMLMFACTAEDDWMRSPGTINASRAYDLENQLTSVAKKLGVTFHVLDKDDGDGYQAWTPMTGIFGQYSF